MVAVAQATRDGLPAVEAAGRAGPDVIDREYTCPEDEGPDSWGIRSTDEQRQNTPLPLPREDPLLQARYGAFPIEPPLSEAMERVVNKLPSASPAAVI